MSTIFSALFLYGRISIQENILPFNISRGLEVEITNRTTPSFQ